ncbi:MAG: class I SAM-dependent methyltransferase [Anaerolineaceae bacterium]|nr:class I SAM-dependent methyltransferase [Anaerolineaceae bacterium]
MLPIRMIEKYADWQAWLHDYIVGQRALKLHAFILKEFKLEPILAEKRERSVLDIGCGGGQAVIRLKELYPHLDLTGIDLTESQIARAEIRAKRKQCQVQFEVADALALPFPDAHFDVVYSFGSVKHWPDPLKGIRESWRVLKPGGELLLIDSTSDATREQMLNFLAIAKIPSPLRPLLAPILESILVRHARPMSTYYQIAEQLNLPPGTVTKPASLPTFLFRTKKPLVANH